MHLLIVAQEINIMKNKLIDVGTSFKNVTLLYQNLYQIYLEFSFSEHRRELYIPSHGKYNF